MAAAPRAGRPFGRRRRILSRGVKRAMDGPPQVPAIRVKTLVDRPLRPDGEFVVYWMTAARRLGWNYALDHAVAIAEELARPLVVLEALRSNYPWASDRLHRFAIEGMAENARRAAGRPVFYYPYLEPAAGAGRGLVAELSRRAAAIVTDDAPFFFLPRMLALAASRSACRLEAVDSNGLLPVAAGAHQTFATAFAFRRFLHGNLKRHLLRPPSPDPLAGARLPRLERLPEAVEATWPPAGETELAAEPELLARLPIDHSVAPVAGIAGGSAAAEAALARFLEHRLARYAEERNHPDADAASGLSPWLHYGHLSAHQVLAELAAHERWDPALLPEKGNGGREGWWGTSAAAESFLDELVTWREIGLNFCATRPEDHDRYESLPGWARATLEAHEADPRRHLYELPELERAATHDELWNAAQRQLLAEGRIQNYLRMLWGKKVLEWSSEPRRALEILIELNNKYALDGRDPNSYSGIFWCLGRYDRPWAPERPIFGVVRYMSSENTARKLKLQAYLRQWSAPEAPTLF